MGLTLRQLDYFIATAESGQVSQAAAALNISQSAVTAAIKGLEAELGVRLLERTHSGVRLTMEGSRFLEHARTITAAVSAAVRSPLRKGQGVSGRLRLGISYTVVGYYMSRHYARFRKTYPDIEVEVLELPRHALEKGVVSGDVDMAVMLVSNLSDKAAIDHEILMRSTRRLWLPADHRFLALQKVGLADIAGEDYVMLTVDEAQETAARYWQKAGLSPRAVLTTSSVEAVRSLVAAGIGVTILSDMVFRSWSLEGQRIEVRDVIEPIPTMDVGLAWARARPINPTAAAFRAFMSMTMGGAFAAS